MTEMKGTKLYKEFLDLRFKYFVIRLLWEILQGIMYPKDRDNNQQRRTDLRQDVELFQQELRDIMEQGSY